MGVFVVTARDEQTRTVVVEHAAETGREHPTSVTSAQLRIAPGDALFDRLPLHGTCLLGVESLL